MVAVLHADMEEETSLQWRCHRAHLPMRARWSECSALVSYLRLCSKPGPVDEWSRTGGTRGAEESECAMRGWKAELPWRHARSESCAAGMGLRLGQGACQVQAWNIDSFWFALCNIAVEGMRMTRCVVDQCCDVGEGHCAWSLWGCDQTHCMAWIVEVRFTKSSVTRRASSADDVPSSSTPARMIDA